MPKVTLRPGVTDEQFIVGLLRATGVLCVYGSGFGTRPEDGYFRVVFLASPAELEAIYAEVGRFAREFLGA
jgi:aspartate/methionine/tyrosine aminotransferase